MKYQNKNLGTQINRFDKMDQFDPNTKFWNTRKRFFDLSSRIRGFGYPDPFNPDLKFWNTEEKNVLISRDKSEDFDIKITLILIQNFGILA